ncbi:MAG: hypothetical protein R8L58_07350, partial [Mariprofundaceae bacterium]
MERIWTVRNCAFLMLLAMAVPVSAMASDSEGYLPEGVQIYRGGEAVEDRSNAMVLIIYTKDNPKRVMGFYRKTLGMTPIQGRSFYLGDDHTGTQIDSGPIFLTVAVAS